METLRINQSALVRLAPAANTPFLLLYLLPQKEGSQRKKRLKEEFGLTFQCSCGRAEHLTVFLTGSQSDFRHEIR